MRFIEVLLLSALLFSSCESPTSKACASCEADEKALQETPDIASDSEPQQAETVAQATGDNLVQSKQSKKFAKDKKENHLKIVQKYGEQWDFCTCVVANDSINKVSEKGMTEKQAAKLMKRWEYVETKCKEFMTNPNTTPEERALHERKVGKCLEGRNKTGV